MANKESEPKFAIAIPTEIKVTKDGTNFLYDTIASDKETAQSMADAMSEIMGGSCKIIERNDNSRSTFSSLDWKRSSWVPKGPKPNWVIPQNPDLN